MTLLLTLKPNNLLLHIFFVFCIHYSGAGSSSWPYPKSMMPSHWLEGRLDLFPLQSSQRMSQGHIISWSVKVTLSLITEVFLDSIKCDASAPWMKATDEISHFTTICVNSLQDKSKNTRLHNFHTSRGNFPFHTFKYNSNGVHEMFSFKIK